MPDNRNKEMDKVCANCNNRFGEHYGSKDRYFCGYLAYQIYRDTGDMMSNSSFIDSGKKCTKRGERYGLLDTKDPNTLWKRKSFNGKNE